MTNYIIEDGIDFFSELKKSLNETETEVLSDNICLLSKEPLIESETIKLYCNHAFNYIPLYKEIKQQKKEKHSYDIVKLKTNEIKCPYCRNIQTKVLPYIKGIKGVTKIRGVNSPPQWEMLLNACEYKFKGGKRKDSPCNDKCHGAYCLKHLTYLEKVKKKVKNKVIKPSKLRLKLKVNPGEKIGDIIINEETLSKYGIIGLYEIAKEYKVKYFSKYNKKDLIAFIISASYDDLFNN
jgi:hypothetical protein